MAPPSRSTPAFVPKAVACSWGRVRAGWRESRLTGSKAVALTRPALTPARMAPGEAGIAGSTPGMEPTNNLAEQAIRFVVIDRYITQGTRSEKGRRWCERI